MVCNIFKILDENQLKQLSIVEYKMTKVNYGNLCDLKNYEYIFETRFDEESCEMISVKKRKENYKEAPPRIKYAIKKLNALYNEMAEYNSQNHCKWKLTSEELNIRFFKWCGGEEIVFDYLEIIPFVPSVMINISPDFGNLRRANKISALKELIDKYMKEQWYEKWEYVIENGSDGTHIHAHIVAQMNSKRLKSTESHLRKGNHAQQLKKYAKSIKGMEGAIKGSSVQKVFLRTEEIVKDKLLYLKEDTKPEGHKNKSVIADGS